MRNELNTTYHLSSKLFVFEGSDGVGKSSVAEKVAERLRKRGADVLLFSFPGREPKSLGNMVYNVHHNARSFGIDHLSPTSLQILHIAAHIDCIEEKILPALSNNKTVILDRYWWSTIVYGMAAGIPRSILNAMVALERTVWGNVKPDKLFLITRKEPFRAELSSDHWARVCKAYETLTEEEKSHYPVDVIENSKPLGEVADIIVGRIQNGFPFEGKCRKIRQESLALFFKQKHKAKHSKKDHWAPTKTTEVFDTYWRFATERQAIFFKRLMGEKEPWS